MPDSTGHRQRLTGRVAIVTGSSRGIGLAIAERLCAEGAQVCLTGRKQDALDVALGSLPPGRAIAGAGRVDDPAHQREVARQVMTHFGRLDILVNNAGINPLYGPLMDADLGAARKILEANFLAPLAWVQECWRATDLGSTVYGSVVNISSVAAQSPSPGIDVYGASKAALEHLTRALALELAPAIRVNAIAPAVVKTDFAKPLYESNETEISKIYPMGRLGTPDDVAALVTFLVSDEAAWITGQVLNVDGGLLVAGGRA